MFEYSKRFYFSKPATALTAIQIQCDLDFIQEILDDTINKKGFENKQRGCFLAKRKKGDSVIIVSTFGGRPVFSFKIFRKFIIGYLNVDESFIFKSVMREIKNRIESWILEWEDAVKKFEQDLFLNNSSYYSFPVIEVPDIYYNNLICLGAAVFDDVDGACASEMGVLLKDKGRNFDVWSFRKELHLFPLDTKILIFVPMTGNVSKEIEETEVTEENRPFFIWKLENKNGKSYIQAFVPRAQGNMERKILEIENQILQNLNKSVS